MSNTTGAIIVILIIMAVLVAGLYWINKDK